MIHHQCHRCSKELTTKEPLKGPLKKYCDECRVQVKRDRYYTYKTGIKPVSVCDSCGVEIDKTGTPAKRYCLNCAEPIKKKKIRQSIDKYREKKGVQVGVGSGNTQGSGKEHRAYKTGIALYKQTVKERGDSHCNRCKAEIDFSSHYNWVVHHIDHNRSNNNADNLELLCKKCHQREHDCFGHKRKNHNVPY